MSLKIIDERYINKPRGIRTLRVFGDLIGNNVWELSQELERSATGRARRLHIVIEDAVHMSVDALGLLVRAKLKAEAMGFSWRITFKTNPPILAMWPDLLKYFDLDNDSDDPTGVAAMLIPPTPLLSGGIAADPDENRPFP